MSDIFSWVDPKFLQSRGFPSELEWYCYNWYQYGYLASLWMLNFFRLLTRWNCLPMTYWYFAKGCTSRTFLAQESGLRKIHLTKIVNWYLRNVSNFLDLCWCVGEHSSIVIGLTIHIYCQTLLPGLKAIDDSPLPGVVWSSNLQTNILGFDIGVVEGGSD